MRRMTEEENQLENEYTPSKFSKRFQNRDELISHHIEFIRNESEKNRFKINCHLNISYGPTFREKLDIYGGDSLADDSPLVVYVHGGYWQEQTIDKWSSAYPVRPLFESGIRTIIIDYDLCPNITLAELVKQVQCAFKWIKRYVQERNIKSMSVIGHSAGAHLIASILTKDFLEGLNVKLTAFMISGVYDLKELRYLEAVNPNNILSLNDKNILQLSPQLQDFSHFHHNIKLFVFVGENESQKFKDQSREFAEGPLKNFNPTFKIFPGLDHFDIVEKLSEREYAITQLVINISTKGH